jgi:hypothetical protein
MRIVIPAALLAASLLLAFGPQTAAADQVTAQPTTQAGAGYGARSLRGLTEAYVEVIDEAAAGATEKKSTQDDVVSMLKGLVKSDSSGSVADKLKADVVAALTSRTAIKPRSDTLDAARAAGAPVLSVKVMTRATGSGSKPPFDVTLSVQQQVALARDPALTFYATTYDTTLSEPANGRGKRKAVADVMDKFIEMWRAAN